MKKINLNELTISEWNKFSELIKDETPDIYSIFEIFGYDVSKLSVNEYESILSEIRSATLSQGGVKKIYKIGDRRYKACLNISKIKAGQFIDLQSYLSNGRKLECLLSVFLIPMKKDGLFGSYKECKYGVDYDIFETQEYLLNNMLVGEANELSFFFLKTSKMLLQYMKESSTRKMMKMKEAKMREMQTIK